MGEKGKVAFITTYSDFFWDFEMGNISIVRDMGYEVILIANCEVPEKNIHKNDLECLGVSIISIPFERKPFKKRTIQNYMILKKVLNDLNPVAVDCHLAVVGVLTRILARQLKDIKVIYSPHGFFFYNGCPPINLCVYRTIEFLLARYTDALIVINSEDYENAMKMAVRGKVYFVNGVGVDMEKIHHTTMNIFSIRDKLKISRESFVFLSVGELNKNKNHLLVLKAISKLQEQGINNFHYIVCGRGENLGYLITYVKEKDIQDRVHFIGYRKDVIQIYKEVDAFIIPSFKEGLSVSTIEAMACGLPILASRIRGNNDLVDAELGGYFFNPNKEEELVNAMKLLLQSRERGVQMGNYNKTKSIMYSKQMVDIQMQKIYKSIL